MVAKEKKALKINNEEIKFALSLYNGNISKSARMLQVFASGFRHRIMRTPELKKHLDEIREGRIDDAETQLQRLIKEGDKDMIKFFLGRVGRHRGYGRAQKTIEAEFSGDFKGPVKFRVIDD